MSGAGAMRAQVSVVVPCYRCTETIDRAVRSVAQQTVLPAQLILVDDGSPDDGMTLGALLKLRARYANLFAIDVVALPENLGVAEARNAGWGKATQPYIAFLDADDAWHPRKLEIQHGYMRSHPEVVICGHGHQRLKRDDIPGWALDSVEAERISRYSMLVSNRFVTPSVMLRAEIPHRFMQGRTHMEDHLLWLQIICDGMRADRLNADLVAIYKHPYGDHGLSAELWRMARADFGNYWLLSSQGRLGSIFAWALMLFALLKFFRRLVKFGFRQMSHSFHRGGARRRV